MSDSNSVQTETLKKLYIELKKSRDKIKRLEQSQREPIAVIGMSCRFPGGANSPAKFWRLLEQGGDAIADVPAGRWDKDVFYDASHTAAGKMHTVKGGFLDISLKAFDAQFFNISPKEAFSLDPQQRLLLEVTWEAMEDACLNVSTLEGSKTGVFLGMSSFDYNKAHIHSGYPERIDAYSLTGVAFSTAAGRISYTYGLEGPSWTSDTACSSSLVALHSAMGSLRNRESDMALVGGVSVILVPETHVYFTKLQAISPDGRCKTFDASANGYSRGEGCGIVVLKRLRDAQRDQDRILAVIRGSAVNQDGKSSGLTAPNGAAQEKVIASALENAGLTYNDIDYVEAHGTGTSLGDPIEVEALGAGYGKERSKEKPLYIGSVKTNIGHLEPVAGMSGLIKVILSLQHENLPQSIHFNTPNPLIPWDSLPVKVVDQLTPWKHDPIKRIRRAGLSAFGFGGTNAHVIIEEAPPLVPVHQKEPTNKFHLLTLSAASEEVLPPLAEAYSEFLNNSNAPVADICYTACKGRTPLPFRMALTALDKAELKEKLSAFSSGDPDAAVSGRQKEADKIAFLFTGQGSQYVGMGRELFELQPVFRSALETCDKLFTDLPEGPILNALYAENADPGLVDRTDYTQPLIFAIQYALAQLWQSWGIEPTAVLGHSIGEYAAAVVAGYLTLEDAAKLVSERGRLMHAAPGHGTMGVIFADEKSVRTMVEPFTKTVSIAAVNAEKNITISGAAPDVDTLLAQAAEQGLKTRALSVSHAFHSPLMQPVLEQFQTVAASVKMQEPLEDVAFISTVTGMSMEDEGLDASYWSNQIGSAVRFYDAFKILERDGYELFMEIGSAPILSSLGTQVADNPQCRFIPSLRKGRDSMQHALLALGKCFTYGMEIDWQSIHQSNAQKVALPHYPFQRFEYWLDPVIPGDESGTLVNSTQMHPVLGQRVTSSLLPDTVIYQDRYTHLEPYFMQEHIIYHTAISPAAAHVSLLLSAVKDRMKTDAPVQLRDLKFVAPLITNEENGRDVQITIKGGEDKNKSFQLASKSIDGQPQWDIHCTGTITQSPAVPAPVDLGQLKARLLQTIDIPQFYETLWGLGYHLGPGFQRIKAEWKGDNEGLAQVDLSEITDLPGYNDYEIYPGFIDSVFHTVMPAARHCMDNMVHHNKVFIPISLAAVKYYQPLSGVVWCHVEVVSETELIIQANMTLFNDAGEILLEIREITAKQTDSSVLFKGMGKRYNHMLYQMDWQPKPLKPETLQVHDAVILFADKGNVALQLQDQLKHPDTTVVTVSKGTEYHAGDSHTFQVDPLSQEDMTQLLGDLLSESGENPVPILYLWGMDRDPGAGATGPDQPLVTSDWLNREQEEHCTGLLNLLQAIDRLQVSLPAARPRVYVITQNVHDISGDAEEISVSQSPLWGMGRTAALENSGIWGGLIDIDYLTAASPAGLAAILDEIRVQEEDQVSIRSTGDNVTRYVARMQHAKLDSVSSENTLFKEDATYLITGGMGALGLETAKWLTQNGASHLLLAGRSAPNGDAKTVIDGLRNEGATVNVMAGDISIEADVLRMTEYIDETMPPLRGIFHAAGVLDDGLLTDQTWQRFGQVFAPKVQGAWNLHRATAELQMDMFVMFSSGTAWMGSRGQGNYTAANEFLNILASYRRGRGLPALSVNWGPWAGKGMAAAQDNRGNRMAEAGIGSIPINDGFNILFQLISSANLDPGIMVVDIDWTKYSRTMPDIQKSGTFCNMVTESDHSGAVAGEGALLEQLEQAPANQRQQMLLEQIGELAAKVLGFVPGQKMSYDKPLTDLGADSLMAVEIKSRIGSLLGKTLPVTLVYEYPSLEKIAQYLMTEVLPFNDQQQAGDQDLTESATDLLDEINSLLD